MKKRWTKKVGLKEFQQLSFEIKSTLNNTLQHPNGKN